MHTLAVNCTIVSCTFYRLASALQQSCSSPFYTHQIALLLGFAFSLILEDVTKGET